MPLHFYIGDFFIFVNLATHILIFALSTSICHHYWLSSSLTLHRKKTPKKCQIFLCVTTTKFTTSNHLVNGAVNTQVNLKKIYMYIIKSSVLFFNKVINLLKKKEKCLIYIHQQRYAYVCTYKWIY